MEAAAMILALVFLCAVLVARLLTAQHIGRLNRQISQIAPVRQEALNRLKTARGQKMVIEKHKAILDRKKNKTAKSIGRLGKEVAGCKDEEAARRSKSEVRKVG